MALTLVDLEIFTRLRRAGAFPPRPSVLELGEAEWFGDVPPEALRAAIHDFADERRREELERRMEDSLRGATPHPSWDTAKVFYAAFLDYRRLLAIDFHGTPEALRIDLNYPVSAGERFDLLIDSGTAEHVFDVQQFFRSCHELTRPGGVMLHHTPFRGWLEHGFYSFNPTFYWDLAGANGYEILLLAYTEMDPPRVELLASREAIVEMARRGALGSNAMLYAACRKPPEERPFAVPAQGFYAGTVSQAMAQAWHELR